MEIAYDLATGGAAKVWLAVRTPPNIMLRQGPGGIPGDFIATPLYHAPVIGFVPRPSQIGFATKQARRAAKAIARELRNGSEQRNRDPIRGNAGRVDG